MQSHFVFDHSGGCFFNQGIDVVRTGLFDYKNADLILADHVRIRCSQLKQNKLLSSIEQL
jgi:hypothetical protein